MMLDSRLLRAAGKANRFVLGAVACQWAGLLVSVATVLLLAYLMSLLAVGGLTPDTLTLVLALLVLGVGVRALLTLLATRMSGMAAEGVKHTMRRKIYCHLLALGNSYSSHVSTAEATQLAGEGVEQLEAYFSRYLPQLLYGLLAPLTLFVVLLFFNPIIALVLLACVPLIPLSIIVVRKIARRFMRSFWGEYAQLGTSFLENVQGLTTLKIYGADEHRHQQMDERAQRFRQVTMRVLGMQLNSIFFMDAIAFGGAALGIILAIHACMTGGISLGACLAIILLSADFFIPLRQLGSSFHVASTGLAAAERMFKLLSTVRPTGGVDACGAAGAAAGGAGAGAAGAVGAVGAVGTGAAGAGAGADAWAGAGAAGVDANGATTATAPADASATTAQPDRLPCEPLPVHIKDLSFSYGNDALALSGISLDIPAGAFVAFVGESGSGKSTLASLLMGADPRYQGELQLAGRPLSSIPEDRLMQRCLAVSHKSHLFKGSVRENLLIAAPDASDQQLQAVLAQVCLWDFFCGLDGLDTAIAEGGANLSGGQQQRFAFARALLYQASLYIFDEVTSNIDVESELIIRELINGLAQTATVVLISHRLANVCACDCIYILEKGELVAQGSHDELSQRPGPYQELWEQQQELERCYPVVQAADGAAAAGAGADGAAGTGAAGTGAAGAVAAAGAAAAEVYVDGVRGDSHTAGAGAPNVASADGAAAGHASTKPTAGDAPATGGKSADRPSAGAGTGAAAGQRRPWTIALRLLKLVRPLTPVMLAAIAMGIIGFLAAIAIPVVGVLGMLEALGSQAFAGIIAVLALCAVLRGFFRYAEQFLNHYIAFKLLALIRSHVFGALRRLAPAKLETRDKGDLVATITADIELLEIFYAHTVSPVAIAVIVSLVMTIAIGFCHPLLALVALAAYLMVGVGLPLLITKLSRSPGRQYRIGFGALSSYVLEGLRNLPEVIQFGIGGERLAEIDRRTEALVHTARKLKHREGVGAALGGATIILFSLLMLVVAWLLYGSGAIGFPAVLVATVAMLSSFGPVTALVGLASNLAHTFAAGDRVLDILDEQPQTTEIVTGSEPGFTGVQYLDVSFSYNDSPVLSGISLEIARGGIVGICGRSGSGKSTILRLLMRFWDVGSGSIRISGVGIAGITTQHLRQIEGFVTQTTHLFSGSIEDNLRVAKLDASADELESACRKASIHDAISAMPQGYQTRLAELGEGLSGGEQQRIGLARAFLHDAPLLLLDEPTSNLDSLNEAIILACLSKEAQSRTVVLVSHRRSTLGVADAVYTLEQGRLVSGMS